MRIEHRGPVEGIELAGRLGPRAVYPVWVFRIGDTLVDSGCARCARALTARAVETGVRRVVHTHHHEDHVGASALLAERHGVEILAPPAALGLLEHPYRLPLYRRLVWGQPRPVIARPLGDEVRVGDHRFQVIPTPGHAPDHVCLFEPAERWLVTGDLFLATRARYLRAVEDAATILDSLRRVVALRPKRLLCSHSGFVEEGARALEAKIRFWEALGEAAERLAAEGLPLAAMTRQLLGPEGWMTRISGGAFAKRHLVASLLKMRGVAVEQS